MPMVMLMDKTRAFTNHQYRKLLDVRTCAVQCRSLLYLYPIKFKPSLFRANHVLPFSTSLFWSGVTLEWTVTSIYVLMIVTLHASSTFRETRPVSKFSLLPSSVALWSYIQPQIWDLVLIGDRLKANEMALAFFPIACDGIDTNKRNPTTSLSNMRNY